MFSEHSDVLSQVLKLIRLRGDHVFLGELGSATEVNFPPGPASFLHMRTGQLSLSLAHDDPVLLRPGDFVLLPHALGHTIGSESGRKSLQCFEAAVGFYPEITDGCERVENFKSCLAILRRILGLWCRSMYSNTSALAASSVGYVMR